MIGAYILFLFVAIGSSVQNHVFGLSIILYVILNDAIHINNMTNFKNHVECPSSLLVPCKVLSDNIITDVIPNDNINKIKEKIYAPIIIHLFFS